MMPARCANHPGEAGNAGVHVPAAEVLEDGTPDPWNKPWRRHPDDFGQRRRHAQRLREALLVLRVGDGRAAGGGI